MPVQLSCNASQLCATKGWRPVEDCGVDDKNLSPDAKLDFNGEFSMDENLKFGKCVDIHLRNVTVVGGIRHKPVCSSLIHASCIVDCHEVPELKRLLEEVRHDHEINSSLTSTYQFHLFLWAAIVSWVGMAVVVSIADAICFDLLGTKRRISSLFVLQYSTIYSACFFIP